MNTDNGHLVGGLSCGAIEDRKPCGGELYEGNLFGPSTVRIPLCERHAANLYSWSTETYRASPIGRMEEQGLISGHLPGYTYIVQLPNGRIKIGTSVAGRINRRWREITRQYFDKGYREPLKPLAIIQGGASKEAALHYRFRESRIRDEFGEQFNPTTDLILFAETEGIPEEQKSEVPTYEEWWAGYLWKNRATQGSRIEEKLGEVTDPWDFDFPAFPVVSPA
ncbi:hypothetical protein ACFQ60_19505 [Streptomyces zhihengii]|uniref:GIY-YIG nuclease family protein n=1 Tax=Streptomyces zhihengii TaxID=1818004 RepID=A0ABS2UVE1_9ACTN|nr:hypothetical protein [Streptomyces zhihengii]MBM9621531.1 hypothetical protein [Streptomyces zhihengii]